MSAESGIPPPDPVLDDVVAGLADRLDLDLWMITRRESDDLSVLAAHGDGLAVKRGMRVPWADTICGRMAAGEGPRAAPALEVPAYAQTPLADQLDVGSYVGVPIEGDDGVEGSICGIDRAHRSSGVAAELPLLEVCANLVARLWRAERDARTDSLTDLANRRSWDEAVAREEERCRRFGHAAAVIAIDLDDFKRVNDSFGYAVGDAHLRRAAEAIAEGVRDSDFVARWGGDEFCVLAVECDERAARDLGERVADALAEAAIPASLALGSRRRSGLTGAVTEAFAQLGRAKHRRVAATAG